MFEVLLDLLLVLRLLQFLTSRQTSLALFSLWLLLLTSEHCLHHFRSFVLELTNYLLPVIQRLQHLSLVCRDGQ